MVVVFAMVGCAVVDSDSVDRPGRPEAELAANVEPPRGAAPPIDDLPWCSVVGCGRDQVTDPDGCFVRRDTPCICDLDGPGPGRPFQCRTEAPAPTEPECRAKGCNEKDVLYPSCFESGALCLCDLDDDGPAEPFECRPTWPPPSP